MATFNLCFLGFGNVARALVALLAEKRDELRARYQIEWRITGVATRRMGWRARYLRNEYSKSGMGNPIDGSSNASI